jgi:hypothetical protein
MTTSQADLTVNGPDGNAAVTVTGIDAGNVTVEEIVTAIEDHSELTITRRSGDAAEQEG